MKMAYSFNYQVGFQIQTQEAIPGGSNDGFERWAEHFRMSRKREYEQCKYSYESCQAVKSHCMELQSEIHSKDDLLCRIKHDLRGSRQALIYQTQQRAQMEAAKARQISKIIAEKRKLQIQFNEQIDNNKRYERMIEELSAELVDKEEQLAKLEKEAKQEVSMKESLSGKSGDIEQLINENESLKQELIELNKTRDETNCTIDQLQQKQTEWKGEIERLQKEKQSIEQELHAKSQELQEANSEISLLLQKNAEWKEEIGRLQNEKQAIEEELHSKGQQVIELNKTIDEINSKMSNLESYGEELGQFMEQRETEWKAEMAGLKDEKKKIELELHAKVQKLEACELEKRELEKKIRSLEQTIEEKVETTVQERDTLQQRVHKVEYECVKLSRAYKKKEELLEEHLKDVSAKDSAIAALQKAVDEKREAMQKMTNVNEAQRSTIDAQMQIKLPELKVTGRKVKGLQQTVQTLLANISDLEAKVASLERNTHPVHVRKEPISVMID